MLKHLLIVAMLLTMSATLSAQNSKRKHDRLPVKEEERISEVCTIPEQLPVFPGGESALLAYVAQHLKYPEQAIRDSVQGVVRSVLSFSKTATSARYKSSNLSNPIATLKPSAW